MGAENVECVLERILREERLVDVPPKQDKLRRVVCRTFLVETHDALDDDTEERLHDRCRDDTKDTSESVESDTRRVREPHNDRLDGVETWLVDRRGADHAVDGCEPRDVGYEHDSEDDGERDEGAEPETWLAEGRAIVLDEGRWRGVLV